MKREGRRPLGSYPEDSHISTLIFSLGVQLRRSAVTTFRRDFGLSSTEWSIIGILYNNGALSVGGICERLGKDKAQVSRDIASLTARGLLRGQRDEVDRRRILIDFTDEALPFVDEFAEALRERNSRFIAGLTPEQQAELRRMLVILLRNAREMRDPD
jgi:DNA-binding MarR family transcriptional regulator